MTTAAQAISIAENAAGVSPATQELAGMLSAYTDVTERLKASHDRLAAEVSRLRGELASKNRQLERRSRLAALGEMAAGMAHEIRNPLGGIALYAGLLVRQLADQPARSNLAQKIADGVGRLDTIVNDILAFAGEIQPQKRRTQVSAILGEARMIAQGRLEKAAARLHCDWGDASLNADPGLLTRAVANLLYNACDAAAEGEIRLSGQMREGMVVIEVADSGPGIPTEVMDRIFNPFFTTKDAGTGLGLAIVHRIVESHGGQITVENAAAPEGLGGARFVIRLPRE